MKQYKLLKDILHPGWTVKAGEVFTQDTASSAGAYLSSCLRHTLSPSIVEDNPEWFEEAKPSSQLKIIDTEQYDFTFCLSGNSKYCPLPMSGRDIYTAVRRFHGGLQWTDKDMIEFGFRCYNDGLHNGQRASKKLGTHRAEV